MLFWAIYLCFFPLKLEEVVPSFKTQIYTLVRKGDKNMSSTALCFFTRMCKLDLTKDG